jgi:quercetin dioxygenase-like cupin family protein
MESGPPRLRKPPAERFAGPQHAYDLAAAAKRLREEVQAGESGHRQETLYRHGKTTVSLFLFGHLTRLPPHRAAGVVCIHLLKGRLRITVDGNANELLAGHLLVLAPGVEHDLVAYEESEVLLTVSLDPPPASPLPPNPPGT